MSDSPSINGTVVMSETSSLVSHSTIESNDASRNGSIGVKYGGGDDEDCQSSEGQADETVDRNNGMKIGHHHAIGMLGSMAIACNSLTGPAMLELPATYQRSGIIPTTVTLIFVCVLSSLCSLHMANTISKVPNNRDFQQEVEFSDVFDYFWGHGWFIATQIIFFGCVSCLNISSIVDTSQVVDTFMGHWLPGGSAALRLSGEGVTFVRWSPALCTAHELARGECIPFLHGGRGGGAGSGSGGGGGGGILLTLGYMVILAIFFPMALMDLKENATWQIMGFAVLLVVSVQFIAEFLLSDGGPSLDNVSWWGSSWDALFGVVLFNFALVIAIPAWLYERHPTVDVPTVIHGSSVVCTVLYMLVGGIGALAIPHVSDNMLESMMSGVFGTTMQLGASLFAFMIVGLGIPLFSVLTRMNLTGGGWCDHRTGNVMAVYLPFGVAWMLYRGEAVTELLSWGGVLFTSLVAFVLPLLLALHTVVGKHFDKNDDEDDDDDEGSIQVYYRGFLRTRRSQILALRILLALAVCSIVAALAGNFAIQEEQDVDDDDDHLDVAIRRRRR